MFFQFWGLTHFQTHPVNMKSHEILINHHDIPRRFPLFRLTWLTLNPKLLSNIIIQKIDQVESFFCTHINNIQHGLFFEIPSGKRLHNYGKSPFFMGKLTISMAIFNSFLYVYQRVSPSSWIDPSQVFVGKHPRLGTFRTCTSCESSSWRFRHVARGTVFPRP